MKLKFLIGVLLIAQTGMGQIKLPQVSGAAEVEQTIGYTKIEVEYARPNLNKRKAFGGELVPYGKIWRTGANTNTIIQLSSDISIEGKDLKAGKYAIFTIPQAKSWDIVFYSKTDNWGAPEKLDESLVVLKINVPTQKLNDYVETFTIGFKDAGIEHANLYMAWENTMVQMKIEVPTHATADEIIKKELNEKSTAYDYFGVAYYYYSNNRHLDKALEYINIAIQKDNQTPFFKDYKAKIEAKINKK
jgi:hypothetical protein